MLKFESVDAGYGTFQVLFGTTLDVNAGELVVMWLTSAVLCVCVFTGASRRVGFLLLGLYVVFLVVEFAVMHKRDLD